MKNVALLLSVFVLSGCYAGAIEMPDFKGPSSWFGGAEADQLYQETDAQALQGWWHKFNDPVLSAIINHALEENPDRRIAEARILETRGLRRTARAALVPEIGASAGAGREKTVQSSADDYYDARFDASFELDIFGRNRSAYKAANATLESLEAEYQDVSLTLIAEIARTYNEMRANEKQVLIAEKNLDIQEQTLVLIYELRNAGENPQLDVERAENLVNTTKASIPEFKRVAENARLRLALLSGDIPENLIDLSEGRAKILGADVMPVLMAPSRILAMRPDIRAASANLRAQTNLAEAATADIFPIFTLSGFYGVAENAFASSTGVWNIAIGAAVALLDFGRIEGQIDAARAREKQAYELYRKTVLEAVNEVETALNDYARINQQAHLLMKAHENAAAALDLSLQLFNEGEISFLDVLDAQRTVNEADSALVSADSAKADAMIRLYKSLGVGP